MVTEIFPIALGLDTCYVLKGDGVIALDAGQPNRGRAFRDGLVRAGIAPEDVGLILLTHAHWDHMGSAKDLKEITGPGDESVSVEAVARSAGLRR